MRHRIRLLYVVAAAFVIASSGLMILNRLDRDIAVMRDINTETRLQQVAASAQQSDYLQELAVKEDPNYIRTMARGYGYLMPGEIRFVVVNPEVLYDADGEGTL
ncbi:MAG: septum formation initiator family protein [Clostridiales bacterium]|nr:septum formation initiator family protein [Clostridiales bacterium]